MRREVSVFRRDKMSIRIVMLAIAFGLFASVIGCSASTDDPVFGTRLPDVGTEIESPTPIVTVATLTPTPNREYIETPADEMPTVAAVEMPTTLPTPTLIPSATPFPTPIPLLTPTPTPTPVRLEVGESGMTDEELLSARQLILDLINAGRLEAGLVAVVLDDNPSAQLHANDMLANCFLSQWGTDGSKPTLRYNLAGGVHASYSYIWGSSFCPHDPYRYEWDPIMEEVASAYRSMRVDFQEYGNTFKTVGIGLSYQRPNLWVSLMFATDYLRYTDEPTLDNGILSFAYELTNGAVADDDRIDSYVHYDVPLKPLNRGQLARTASSGLGQRIAGIRPPAGADAYWPDDEFTVEAETCRDPYGIDEDSPPPASYDHFVALARDARSFCKDEIPPTANAKWITSGVEQLGPNGVRVTSDLQDLVSQFGAGIYTLQIWAVVDGVDVPVSEYSIFVE